jgi:hypothetical protein
MAIAAPERSLGRIGRLALVLLLIPGFAIVLVDPLQGLYFAAYGLVAAVLIVRRPSNSIGPIVLVLAYGFIVTSLPIGDIDPSAAMAGTLSLAEDIVIWINAWGGAASFTAYLALTLLFPTGRFPASRWRRPAMAMVGLAIAITMLIASAPTIEFNPTMGTDPLFVPNPFAILPGLPIWSLAIGSEVFFLILAMLGLAVASIIVRYRRASGVLRLQLRWLVAALGLLIASVVFGLAVLIAFDARAGFLGWLPASIAFLCVPLAIGIAILRYRLYEIDRIISRTVSYAIVTAILAVVFVAVVVGLQVLFAPVTGNNTVAVAASTLVVAALFSPLRRRIQAIVDHRFNRARYDTERTAAGFAARLRDEVDLDSLQSLLIGATDGAVRPRFTTIWLRTTPSEPAR